MSKVEGRWRCLHELGLVPDRRSKARQHASPDEAEALLLREMRAIYTLHDLYHGVVNQPVPQHLADLVLRDRPLHGRER